jgi:hypothetical protein
MSAPVMSLADLLVAVLERGVVLVLRLEGRPGDRRLHVGLGFTDSADALLLALAADLVGQKTPGGTAWPNW